MLSIFSAVFMMLASATNPNPEAPYELFSPQSSYEHTPRKSTPASSGRKELEKSFAKPSNGISHNHNHTSGSQ